ncbi:MAG: type II toxin-antitoxin system RelB/DinJ family antitoxin [Verrucomicrobiales bacterium]|nr:type II toxin-antitoxin system RelB/DinJ family antitoxin [Verrucomicrobiales bacterium]
MATTTKSSVQVRLDKTLKEEAETIFDNLGVDAPTAIRMFFKKVVATRSIPFRVEEPPYIFTKEEEAEILQSVKESYEATNTVAVTKTHQETQTFLDSLK